MSKKRLMFSTLVDFIENNNSRAVALLSGIRLTGKTTLLRQLQEKYSDCAVYIDASRETDSVVKVATDAFCDDSISLILIDEISYLSDYETMCQTFFDQTNVKGKITKVIITGSSPSHLLSLSNSKLGARAELFRLPLLTFIEYLYFTDKIKNYSDYKSVKNDDFASYLKMEGMTFSDAPNLSIKFDERYFESFYREVDEGNRACRLATSIIDLKEGDLVTFLNLLAYKLSEFLSYTKNVVPEKSGQEHNHLKGLHINRKPSEMNWSGTILDDSIKAVGDISVSDLGRILHFLISAGLATLEYTRFNTVDKPSNPSDIKALLRSSKKRQDLEDIFSQVSICMVSPLFYTRIGEEILKRKNVDIANLYKGTLYGKMLEVYIRGAVCMLQQKSTLSVQKLQFEELGEVDIWDRSLGLLCEVSIGDKKGSDVNVSKYFPTTELVRVCTSKRKRNLDTKNNFHWVSFAELCCLLDTGDILKMQRTTGIVQDSDDFSSNFFS